ncbi:hypothetical protein [Insolitispirillum peregrinum]|uniref:Protease inhibitor Inh n=1 Tax=Insolitispirillum peregrinum TaxID=80876 RepID=A0A1N7K2X2_9PROT|nr:hypothetical protein [Insolitispirillum peregrinum]SIS55952.1 hypothetical protein SAMN05421779_102583 [Insolitispirillum peregrinum]
MVRAPLIALLATIASVLVVSEPVQAQQYTWVNDVPGSLKGTWVVQGQQCSDPDSQLAIFSDGGYRWRKSRTEWGFARGKYSSISPQSATVYFRLQRLVEQEEPDFSITAGGNELKKYSFGSGSMQRYDKCP